MSETAAAAKEVHDLYPGLIVRDDGTPFKDRKAAAATMNGRNIKNYSVVPVDGGFAVKVERFWRVRFHAKAQPNDQEDVQLTVNGETLIIAREKEVVIPDRFRECADHATYEQFRQMPGEPRKVSGKIRVFPYDILGEATEQEYRSKKDAGTRKTMDIIKKFGHDIDPSKVMEDE
ncbi:MAG TPA: hypothetical protein PLA18_16170 [Deltaproteobacteria bacterium]|jgi:hypothetical protein|nr:hypothetical protein [Deltaproteobacteria bacterium]